MDSRFHLKAEFSIYGEDFEWDCSLNWCSDPGEIDERITQFFLGCYNKAYEKYQDEIFESDRRFREGATKAIELAELKRLKEKYEK